MKIEIKNNEAIFTFQNEKKINSVYRILTKFMESP